jgi:3-hydroxyisobutyrate dehydrogenase-like beta-hydroxyacid dehydrogenase
LTRQRIGFVGVGAMGMPMAKRLLEAGYDVVFTSRRDEAVEMLEQAGGRAVPTPLIVAEECDTFLTCLPADAELSEVYLGPEGVVEYLKPGSTIIDFSTTSPMMIKRVAAEAVERGIRVVDAPVSGGVWGAERGTLTIMAGGDEQVLDEVRPILSALSQSIFHVGDVGMGKVFKLVNNALTGTMMVLVGETLAVAANAGADLEMLHQVVTSSSGSSVVWSDSVPKLLHGDDSAPGFRLELMRKDIRLAASLGEDLGTPMPLTSLALQFFTAACARGMGKQGASDVANIVGRMSGAEFLQTDRAK